MFIYIIVIKLLNEENCVCSFNFKLRLIIISVGLQKVPQDNIADTNGN